MTWPHVLTIATRATEHQDVFFNLWRLRWVHHALTTSPSDLFNGNQFYPESRVLAYSDAMLVESLLGTPMLAAGLPPLLVHNLLFLGAFAASGFAMFVLARHVTASTAGAVLAGVVFAFAPYRFGHYMHMELQWAFWIPLAFWALLRTFETGTVRFGILTGVFVALQIMSAIYYGIFLALALAAVGGLHLVFTDSRRRVAAVKALAAGAVLAVCVTSAYAIPYRAAAARVGTRGETEILRYSARARSYLSVTEGNFLYGRTRAGSAELTLFPGYAPVMLAIAGVVLARPTAPVVISLVGLLFAVDLSFGLNGVLYPWLFEHSAVFKGLRAPARASILVLMFLGVLAARGWSLTSQKLPARVRTAAALIVIGAALLEYWVVPVRLTPYPNQAPLLYSFLARQPPGLVAEFPMPRPDTLPGHEARYAYTSTFHWLPLVNGYSGYYPPSYITRLERVRNLADRRGVDFLRREGVRYVIVHEGNFADRVDFTRMFDTLTEAGAIPLARLNDGWAAATVFELR